MKKFKFLTQGLFSLLLSFSLLTFTGCGDDDGPSIPVPTETLYQLMSSRSDLSQMKAFIDADATLLGYANGTTAYTLFAPNDAAFETLKATLTVDDLTTVAPSVIGSVLLFHFSAGAKTKAEITNNSFTTVQGEENEGNADGTLLRGGTNSNVVIAEADVQAINGTMHVVETILIPPTIFESIGENLGTIAQPYLLGAVFTDIVGVIGVADSDVPSGEMSISGILSDRTGTLYTAFLPANAVLDGVAAAAGLTKEQLIGSLTASPAAARGFLLNQISNTGIVKGSDITAGTMITMMSTKVYVAVETAASASNPLGLSLFPVGADQTDLTKYAPIFSKDIIDVNSTGAAINGSAHVSSILQ